MTVKRLMEILSEMPEDGAVLLGLEHGGVDDAVMVLEGDDGYIYITDGVAIV